MAAQRFFLKHIDPASSQVVFPRDIAHQIQHVLRLQAGDQVTVLDGGGAAYQVALNPYEGDTLTASILQKTGESVAASPARITLFFPLTRREKVEWILQKGTEVGVSVFHPFICARALVQDTALPLKRRTRWETIVREAAEQSGRVVLPQLTQPRHLSSILAFPLKEIGLDAALVAAVEEKEMIFSAALDRIITIQNTSSLGLFIGAEGGFSPEEMDLFKHREVPAVSLGATILRMETAAIIFPALVIHHLSQIPRLK